MSYQPPARAVLRKAAPQATTAPAVQVDGQSSAAEAELSEASGRGECQVVEPCRLLDASSWQMIPQAVAAVLSTNQHFTVTGVLGAQGLGKSAFLNRLLGFAGELPTAGPHPTPAFPVWPCAAEAGSGRRHYWQHCTRGVELRVSSDRHVALDTQPLFSASVLTDIVAEWEQQPPAALAAPALAAAGEGKAAAVPYEGVQWLAQAQLAVLLLSTCHRVLVFCEGLGDTARRTWEFLLTAEMLARGIPDPSLPPRDAQQQAAPSGATTAAIPPSASGPSPVRHAPTQEHLAEVVLVHVLPSNEEPTLAQLQLLEQQLAAFFAGSRVCRPGPLRLLDHLQRCDSVAHPKVSSNGSTEGMSYWVLPSLGSSQSRAEGDPAGWLALVAELLSRPCPPFARRCSEQQWLRGFAGDCWRAVRKSTDVATFYSRLARTQFKGAGGWGLAR